MAKKAAAVSQELEKTQPTGELMGVPADLAQYAGKGTENLGSEDVRPPRLLLAQSMSPQVKKSEQKYIKDLTEMSLFNDLTEQIYGEGPIEIVIITCLGARGVQFGEKVGDPIVDYDVPLNDPRMQFTTNPDNPKDRIKPIATKFYDYLLWLPETSELVAFSMKGTQLKVAATLNSLIKYPLKLDEKTILSNPPSWARTFLLGTCADKRDSYTFANFTVKLKGLTPQETREQCAVLHEVYAKKRVIIERDAADADDRADAPGADKVPF